MNQNRFSNINIDLIIQNLQIEEKQIADDIEEFKYESPKANPLRHNKYENNDQEREYKISSKYKGNQNTLKKDDNYSSLDEEQQNETSSNRSNKENDCISGGCTPPRKNNIQQFFAECDEEINHDNFKKNPMNDNILRITPSNIQRTFCSPKIGQVDDDAKHKVKLDYFKQSTSSSNKNVQELHQQQKIKQQQHLVQSSNCKNNKNNLFEKESPPSCISNKNNQKQSPQVMNFLNILSATPSKNLAIKPFNASNKKYNTNSLSRRQAKSQIFMSTQPRNCNSGQFNLIHEKVPSFSKKLFQDDNSDKEDDNITPVSKFECNNFQTNSNIMEIEENDIPKQSPFNHISKSNNLFSSPHKNSKKMRSPLYNNVNSQSETQYNLKNNMRQNNLFYKQLDTIHKKGLIQLQDDQTTIKREFQENPFMEEQNIQSLNLFKVFQSQEQKQEKNKAFNEQHQIQNINGNKINQNNLFKDINIDQMDTIPSNKNIKIDTSISEENQLSLPQVNEFSFETEKDEDNNSDKNQNRINDISNNSFNDYDSDNFIRKKIRPVEKWEDDTQLDEVSQNEQTSSIFGDDLNYQQPHQLMKGKSVNLLSFENELRNLNESNSWNPNLNRRNSEVGLDSNDQKNKIQIDIGENEFTRAMPGVKIHQRQRLGSLIHNKKRSQTVLFQIPEGSSKKPKQIQQMTHPFELEDDFDVQTPMRSKMIEQQDFQTLFKKASSQFIANNITERNYIRPGQYIHMQHNKENRFMKDFKVIQVLKQTSSTSVYKCQSNVNGLIYAIKAISIPLDIYEQDRIIKEVQSLVKFSTYGFSLLKFYNVWMEDSKLYLVTEHCLHNLRQIRGSNQKPSEQLIRQIIRDICECLHFLHQNDCAHLGIKPENILISKKMRFKLADLGLSKIYNSENNSNQESHYPYIAPELVGCSLNKQNIKSTKADIFSLGAVLYELMTDQDLPKYGPEWENLRQGRFHKLMNSVKYSASLKNLIKSMLLRNPQLRPSSQDILNQIPSDNALELELKYMVEENNSLQKKLDELQKKQEQNRNEINNYCHPILMKKNSL